MRTVSDKSCRENQNKHFVLSKFLFLENPAVYEIMWRNTVERGRPQTTISRMNIACWIPKTTRIHTGCEILVAFLLQQWLLDWASKLHYAQIVCLVPYGAHEGDERNCISMQCNTLSRNKIMIAEKFDVLGSVHHSTIHKKKSNKMQQCTKILLFHIYIKLNMFRATHRPSSGA